MPSWIWLLLLVALLVLIGHYVTERLIQVIFYVLALVVAIITVSRLLGWHG